ncbi:hypothetical protein CSAL01_01078 [Colletotrichum salicis]|uniref:Calcineurin-like phosphoesterase domain-containing protein n=1 Tax=Colletotrichum salicis TaxID=1209931 RepID=A0A135T0B0_9PEZI|nr:hypothetical protein CSAL01_01078 [Colletotrichum salicis]
MSSTTQTRFLIISDTHGHTFPPEIMPFAPVDVLIHCGDLTHHSKMDEYRQTLTMLKAFKASRTLVIAGNHDFSLDTVAFKAKIEQANRIYGSPLEADLVEREFGGLKVYASPYTPSSSSSERWGFSYNESEGHVFDIKTDTDIVITHGPPRGIMDISADQKRIGFSDLCAAVAKSQPRLHCFGHVHGGWGAKNVAWRPQISDRPSHFGDIDHGKSEVIDDLTTLGGTQFESEEDKITGEGKLERHRWQRCCSAGYTRAHSSWSEPKSTMFVNAALEANGELQRFPWIIDIDLPRGEICMASKTEGKRKREESYRSKGTIG